MTERRYHHGAREYGLKRKTRTCPHSGRRGKTCRHIRSKRPLCGTPASASCPSWWPGSTAGPSSRLNPRTPRRNQVDRGHRLDLVIEQLPRVGHRTYSAAVVIQRAGCSPLIPAHYGTNFTTASCCIWVTGAITLQCCAGVHRAGRNEAIPVLAVLTRLNPALPAWDKVVQLGNQGERSASPKT